MQSIRLVFRAEMRRRWASWLALALLIALVGGTVFTGAATARRTASAFPSFESRYGYDVQLFSSSPTLDAFARLPYVTKFTSSLLYANGNGVVNGQLVPSSYLGVFQLPTSHLSTSLKMLSGRLPVRADDAVAGFSMQQKYDLHLGSVVKVPFYAASQGPALFSGASGEVIVPRGPTVSFRIVGFEASAGDFPTSSPSYSLFTSTTFDRTVGPRTVVAQIGDLRLAGAQRNIPRLQVYVNSHQGQGFTYLINGDTSAASIDQSIQPQAVGWWLFALFAGLAGLALVAQALVRQSQVERESYPLLAALGLRPRQLFTLGMWRAAVVGVVGGLGALALTIAFSPLTPVGEARAAEPSNGFYADGLVMGLGMASLVTVVLVLAALPSWRAAKTKAGSTYRDQPLTHANAVASTVANMGAPPSVLVGVRNALEKGTGQSSAPVASALIGNVVAVAALVAVVVFGASLTNLVTTPRLYGQNWQLDLGNMSGKQVQTAVTYLQHNPEVNKITYGIGGKYLKVAGQSVEAVIVKVVKPPMSFSLVSGQYPYAKRQIALGATTLAQIHGHLGSRVPVSIIAKSGVVSTGTFTVVGVVTLPPTFSIGGLGVGAVTTLGALEDISCRPGSGFSTCANKISQNIYLSWGMAVGVTTSTPAGRATLARLQRHFAKFLNVLNVPINLVNFGQAVDFPLLLGAMLALYGAATLTHLLFASVRRRRREVALLKTLGFVRRQVLIAVCWQATTVSIIGIVAGVPIGVLVGRGAWRAFATYLGAVPVAIAPVELIVLIIAAIVVVGNLLAIIPATLAARVAPGSVLRES